ncbi:MAG: undecaprenyl/decaprenyl-phosphate alpha-N-acetylglucosaminyl 1-phosphate transferase [Bacteroidales bacterium]|nr:undecaprenyl/decaprenyl-phosphate alpha-N-acetylglucosaminyl 1-phosphate transferase [Bacteroidales bacterium]
MLKYFQIVLASFVAFFAVKWAYFKILKIAKDSHIVDNPDSRKLQRRPIPVLGGIAVFFGLIAGILAGASLTYLMNGIPERYLAPVLCASVIMIYTGAMDDILGLSPKVRFLIEFFTVLALIYGSGACIDSFHGLWGIEQFSWWYAVPLTLFAGVGIINAINMIDGVNGLCSGLCVVCSIMFGVMFLKVDDIPNAVLAFSLAASVLPFWFHNVFGKKSRMFLGDAGTMMIGIIMVWFTISALRSDSSVHLMAVHKNSSMIAMTLAILSVPVFDTIRVMMLRIFHGKSPFFPDKNHLHHVFIRAGVSHSVTTIIEISINLMIVAIWALSAKLHAGTDVQLYIVVLTSVLLVWGLFFFLRIHEKKHTSFMHRLTKFGVKSHFGHTETWLRLEGIMDAPLADEQDSFDGDELPGRRQLADFLKGKAEVFVSDIKKRSGVDSEQVDAIVREGVESGAIRVVRALEDGSPDIITLIEE